MNLNIPISNAINEDLIYIQQFYTEKTGIKYSKANALRRLIIESSNLIRNIGDLSPNRNWELENMEEQMHREYAKNCKK